MNKKKIEIDEEKWRKQDMVRTLPNNEKTKQNG